MEEVRFGLTKKLFKIYVDGLTKCIVESMEMRISVHQREPMLKGAAYLGRRLTSAQILAARKHLAHTIAVAWRGCN
jgi:hypothetical protein